MSEQGPLQFDPEAMRASGHRSPRSPEALDLVERTARERLAQLS